MNAFFWEITKKTKLQVLYRKEIFLNKYQKEKMGNKTTHMWN